MRDGDGAGVNVNQGMTVNQDVILKQRVTVKKTEQMWYQGAPSRQSIVGRVGEQCP